MKMRLVPSEATEECMTNTLDIEVRLRALANLAEKATPGPWAFECTSKKANDYCVGIVCPVDAEGNVGSPIAGRVDLHPHYFDMEKGTFGEWYCEQVACLDESFHTREGSVYGDASFIAHARTAPFREAADEIARLRARLDAAPHAGKVSAEQFREAVYASCSALTAFGCGCFSVKYPPCKGNIKQVRAVLEAIGLEVEG